MGLGLYFAEGEGPKFERPLREEWEIRDLIVPDPHDHLRYVIDAVSQIRKRWMAAYRSSVSPAAHGRWLAT